MIFSVRQKSVFFAVRGGGVSKVTDMSVTIVFFMRFLLEDRWYLNQLLEVDHLHALKLLQEEGIYRLIQC